jgi:hypothetical protein
MARQERGYGEFRPIARLAAPGMNVERLGLGSGSHACGSHAHGRHEKATPEGPCFVISRPLVRWTAPAGALALMAVLVGAGGGPARAQGKLDATYVVTLGGVPIGKGSWSIDVQEDQFTATANGATSGLLRVFASGQGNSAARGTVSNGQPVASTYASSIVADNKADQVRIFFSGGAVKEYLADPPTMPSPDRVPLTEANRKGVLDPMTTPSRRRRASGRCRYSTAACATTCSSPSSTWTR